MLVVLPRGLRARSIFSWTALIVGGFTSCVVAVLWWFRHSFMWSGWDEKYCATFFVA